MKSIMSKKILILGNGFDLAHNRFHGGFNMEHHNIDIWPIPEDKKPCYINEPWLTDGSVTKLHRQLLRVLL